MPTSFIKITSIPAAFIATPYSRNIMLICVYALLTGNDFNPSRIVPSVFDTSSIPDSTRCATQ